MPRTNRVGMAVCVLIAYPLAYMAAVVVSCGVGGLVVLLAGAFDVFEVVVVSVWVMLVVLVFVT
jgi:hypothetical protein